MKKNRGLSIGITILTAINLNAVSPATHANDISYPTQSSCSGSESSQFGMCSTGQQDAAEAYANDHQPAQTPGHQQSSNSPSAVSDQRRCIPPNYRFLMRLSVTGIGQSVRQFRSEPHPTTHEYLTKTVLSHPNLPWQGLPVTPRLCPRLARFCWPHPHSSTLTVLVCASVPMASRTRISTSPP